MIKSLQRLAFVWRRDAVLSALFGRPVIVAGVIEEFAVTTRPAVRWLIESDPSIRWQAMRDLTDAPEDEIAVGTTRSSFNTTICVLEALLEYERSVEDDARVNEARLAGQKFLFERRLFRRKSEGRPSRWNKLRALRALDWYSSGRPGLPGHRASAGPTSGKRQQ
jgi:hypothetical protein